MSHLVEVILVVVAHALDKDVEVHVVFGSLSRPKSASLSETAGHQKRRRTCRRRRCQVILQYE